MPGSIYEALLSLKDLPPVRPPGLIEAMHYGFDLRNGGYRYNPHGSDEWELLEEKAAVLDSNQLEEILSSLEARSWEAGSHRTLRLAMKLWPRLSAGAKGSFLAGVARHLRGPSSWQGQPVQEEPLLVDFILGHAPAASLDAQGAAEIAANAIRVNQPAIVEAVLAHPQFDPAAPVARIPEDETSGFEKQISMHATRTLDVLLECAVRCVRPEIAERLLLLGANPDLPCWNLERSFSDSFSLLSFTLHSRRVSDDREAAMLIFDLLLKHGANPKGLPCEGLNHPLKLALDISHWSIANRLLDLGATFSGGRDLTPKDFEKNGKLVQAGHPYFRVSADDLRWVAEKIAPLVPLLNPWQMPLFYSGNAQGGRTSSFLRNLLAEDRFDQLKHFEARGLPTQLTPAMVIDLVDEGHYNALRHLLRNEPNLPRVMFRARRRNPEIGTSRLQAWLCQPQDDRVNELLAFDPSDQEAVVLPDGSRFYFYLDAVAPPEHELGPIAGGCFWLEEHEAEHRRRFDRVVVRRLQRGWRMVKMPTNDFQIRDMIPVVKEVAGRFFLPGIKTGQLQRGQRFPKGWRPLIYAWLEQPLGRAMEKFHQRILDQLARTPLIPDSGVRSENETR